MFVHTESRMGSMESWTLRDVYNMIYLMGVGNKVRRCLVFEEVNDEIHEKVVLRICIVTFPVGTDISYRNEYFLFVFVLLWELTLIFLLVLICYRNLHSLLSLIYCWNWTFLLSSLTFPVFTVLLIFPTVSVIQKD